MISWTAPCYHAKKKNSFLKERHDRFKNDKKKGNPELNRHEVSLIYPLSSWM